MNLKELKKGKFTFVYVSGGSCSVCHALLPKMKKVSEKYPEGEFIEINLEVYPHAAGEFSVFSIPALIVYSEGKELYRGARFFNMGELEEKLDRYYTSIFDL